MIILGGRWNSPWAAGPADEIRFQAGTDDNALKNVQGTEAGGISPAEYVERAAQGFLALREALDLSFDDFTRVRRLQRRQ